MSKKLRVFLCHASQDKPAVSELYHLLKSEAWIDPWLDVEKLLGGQDFDLEIHKATRDADAIIICLSTVSVAKEGYVNKEIRRALEIAQEKTEGAIYVIPLRLDDCIPSFEKLKQLHWVDYFTPAAHERLLKTLSARAQALKIKIPNVQSELSKPITISNDEDIDFYRFTRIDSPLISYPLWFAKYPVTNRQYERFFQADDFAKEEYWRDFPKYDGKCNLIGSWKDEGWNWLREELKDVLYFPRSHWKVKSGSGNYLSFEIEPDNEPVVDISWYEANAYCKWLFKHWRELPEFGVNGILPQQIRLPLENEWIIAAGGDNPEGRYPWDKPGKVTIDYNEIKRRSNIHDPKSVGGRTPVNQYPEGKSPYGVMDMVGNVWEWQANCDLEFSYVRGTSYKPRLWGYSDEGYGDGYYDSGSYEYEDDSPPIVSSWGYGRESSADDTGFRVTVVPLER